jgi:putative methyltransferase (TIGR04325 family)
MTVTDAQKPSSPSPVVLLAFNRPDHLARTLKALAANDLADATELFVYADGPRRAEDRTATDAVRHLARHASGFRRVTVIERPHNLGLARNVIEGVTEVCEQHGRVIVVEDDLITSPHFLRFMNDALDAYADDDRVASVHGYTYPTDQALPPNFFLRGADCWGWATWRRAWRHFNPDGLALYKALIAQHLEREFNFGDNYDYMGMLRDQIDGRNNSWAVRWYASAFLKEMLTLYPGRSLVHNIGNDDSGTHSQETQTYDVALSQAPIELTRPPVEDDAKARALFAGFMGKSTRIPIRQRIKSWWRYAKLRLRMRNDTRRQRRRFLAIQAADRLRLEGPYIDWAQCEQRSRGYNQEHILAQVTESVLKVKRGEAAFERDSVLFDRIEYAWPALSGLLRSAALHGGALRVLDFGGSLGSSYFQNRKFISDLPELAWGVVEQPAFVTQGQRLIAEGPLQFFPTIQACNDQLHPNVALFSSVLQYLPDPHAVLRELRNTTVRMLIIDRTPFSNAMQDECFVQHIPASIYTASYPIRVFSRRLFELELAQDWTEIESFEALDNIPSMISAQWEGRIYVRK